ncbi:MAG: S9 family peptidase [Deltaproteobacteria bacterium]|nr:S9 family peptidase [Deltaproteobacteria bacterium]
MRPSEVRCSGSGDLYWVELRPAESGRSVVVRGAADGTPRDVIPAPFDARTRVHEYGGGAYTVFGDTVFFSNFADQQLYRQDAGAAPRAITPGPIEPSALRYADFELTRDGRRLYCVRESHEPGVEARNELVCLDADGSGDPRAVVSGHDFVAFPRLSPDGRRLAFTSWEHPQMPWDGTELWLADVRSDGSLGAPVRVAGGTDESLLQPVWSPDGVLHFVSDRSGWWNLYRAGESGIEALAPRDAEFAQPQWGLAPASYAFLGDGRIVCAWSEDWRGRLGVLDATGLREVPTPWEAFGRVTACGDSRVAAIAASPGEAPAVVVIDVDGGAPQVIRRSRQDDPDPGYLSTPEPLSFPSPEGESHALFYPPANADFEAPPGERPPLLVLSHGGPTAAASAALNLGIQYWTSRGFAVVDVDYGGSTGYGRAYRNRLRGRWGIVDSQDCIAAARALCDDGRADPDRLAIRGGSAGGYTTLCALTFHDVFAAGTSYYGVADAEALAADTHKFESRYLDSLIGPYPEARETYRERSPIHFAERLSCPLLVLQGLEDRVVPPEQAAVLVAALRKRGLPHAYLAFEGEQHGFRRAETIIRAQEAELSFYGRIFGFAPADEIEPITIHNLDDPTQV